MAIAQLIGALVIIFSLWKRKSSFWICASAYLLICLGLAAVFVIGYIPAVGIGYAFASSPIPFTAFIPVIGILFFVLAPAISLFPFVPTSVTKIIGFICFALLLPLIIVFAFMASGGMRGDMIRVPYGSELLFLTLLWLRIFDLKRHCFLEEITPIGNRLEQVDYKMKPFDDASES